MGIIADSPSVANKVYYKLKMRMCVTECLSFVFNMSLNHNGI